MYFSESNPTQLYTLDGRREDENPTFPYSTDLSLNLVESKLHGQLIEQNDSLALLTPSLKSLKFWVDSHAKFYINSTFSKILFCLIIQQVKQYNKKNSK